MKKLLALVIALAWSSCAFAQASWPTASPDVAHGAVVLQCDAAVTACVPVTSSNPLQVSGSITSSGTVTGNVASGAADSGNPVKVAGKYNATPPGLTDGNRSDLQVDSNGMLDIRLHAANVTAADAVANGALTSATFTTDHSFSGRPLLVAEQYFNGTTWDRQRGDTNGIATQPGLSATFWYYTSGTTAILSNTTTAVTLKTAAGASVRNYIDACQIASTALGASVPLAIRDGAAGTVIWAMRPPAAGWTNPIYVNFSPPLRSTANTLLEIVTTTADTSGTFDVNCQGHTGS